MGSDYVLSIMIVLYPDKHQENLYKAVSENILHVKLCSFMNMCHSMNPSNSFYSNPVSLQSSPIPTQKSASLQALFLAFCITPDIIKIIAELTTC